jgi:TM2 domain-containing membrane protein YozV
MTAVACPYCRAKIGEEDPSLACEGCGTLHHSDCYAENGGCTIFGCSKAPADEPKVRVSAPELVAVATQVPAVLTETRVAPPPPPPGGGIAVSTPDPNEALRRVAYQVVPSIFGGFGNAPEATLEPAVPQPKSRTTYILLGALLGFLGAHSFYAGYKTKGAVQLAITLLSLGFAGPMSWIWAVIDICTINQDYLGVQFES